MVYVANFCKDLVLRDKTATIREMYYISEGWGIEFNNQQESNIVGEDLEVALGATREDLGLMPEEDGASVYGDITLLDGDFEINAARAGKSGYTISPTIDQVELLDCGADFVLAVETMGMFHRLVQEDAHNRFNCLIVGLKGQAARATRRFIKRVNEELGLITNKIQYELLFHGIYANKIMLDIFLLEYDFDLDDCTIQKSEVEKISFYSLEEMIEVLKPSKNKTYIDVISKL